jgi:hypothetical protein
MGSALSLCPSSTVRPHSQARYPATIRVTTLGRFVRWDNLPVFIAIFRPGEVSELFPNFSIQRFSISVSELQSSALQHQ